MTKRKTDPTPQADGNVPVDPTQLPVEVPLAPPPSVALLITLQGFEQIVPTFGAVETWLLTFHQAGRTFTQEQHDALLATVSVLRRVIAEMTPE